MVHDHATGVDVHGLVVLHPIRSARNLARVAAASLLPAGLLPETSVITVFLLRFRVLDVRFEGGRHVGLL